MRRLALGLLLSTGCYQHHEVAEVEEPPPTDCTAALQRGAPAPMPGYCPTRSNRSAHAMPEGPPALRWTLELPFEATDDQVVVAARDRLYVSVEGHLVAVDDEGDHASIAWTADLAPSHPPLVLADDTIFFARRDGGGAEGVWLGEDGRVVRRVPLPVAPTGHPMVDSRGRLFFRSGWSDDASIFALSHEGELLWTRAMGGTIAVAPDDTVVVYESRVTEDLSERRPDYFRLEVWLHALDGQTGEDRWNVEVDHDGYALSGPALDAAGDVHLLVDRFGTSSLMIFDAGGGLRVERDLGAFRYGGPASLSLGADGTSFFKLGDFFRAVSSDGALLWESDVHLNFDVGGAGDGAGRLLLGHRAVDARDGSELWVSEIPAHREDLPDGRTTFVFAGPLVVGDGTLYYLGSPRHVYAASAMP
ncbi:MAG: PQQ-binding-like beta-propeller repeat protein [Polyangiales bacterium]